MGPDPRRVGGLWVLVSFGVAMMLTILPWPQGLAFLNPDWMALALLFWAFVAPERVGIVTAWAVGLLADALTGRLLGQHAIAYGVMMYLALRFRDPFLGWAFLLQGVWILVLLLTGQLLVLWTQHQELAEPFQYRYWWPSLSGTIVWVLIGLLAHVRRQGQIQGG